MIYDNTEYHAGHDFAQDERIKKNIFFERLTLMPLKQTTFETPFS